MRILTLQCSSFLLVAALGCRAAPPPEEFDIPDDPLGGEAGAYANFDRHIELFSPHLEALIDQGLAYVEEDRTDCYRLPNLTRCDVAGFCSDEDPSEVISLTHAATLEGPTTSFRDAILHDDMTEVYPGTFLAYALAYAVGKGGVFGFTNAASRDLSAFGITVNAVNPASTETPMVISALAALEDLGEAGRTRAARLRKAMQSPEQVAVVIAALATPAAAGVNGRFLLVEGNRVGLFQPLAISQSAEAAQPWEVGDLARTLAGFDLETDPDPYA